MQLCIHYMGTQGCIFVFSECNNFKYSGIKFLKIVNYKILIVNFNILYYTFVVRADIIIYFSGRRMKNAE